MPEPTMIWVKSDVALDGTYIATVEVNADRVFALDRERGIRYAMAVSTVCQHAEYDAAVFAQLTGKLGLDKAAAAQILLSLRKDRAPLNPADTAPLLFEPGVSSSTGLPFVHLKVDGKLVAQIDTPDAAGHAANVLSVLAAVDLDTAYYAWLRSTGQDELTCRAAVGDLLALRSEGGAG